MFQLQLILRWLQGSTLKLLVLAGVLLLSWGIFAPVGTLVWWLGQSAESLGFKRNSSEKLPEFRASDPDAPASTINCYIIFLPGVGDFSANQLTAGEEFFLARLAQLHPGCVTVRNVFPYSAANQDLAGERFLTPLWEAAENADGWLKNADILIKIRNLWRFAISADDRYGPIYSQGIADAIVKQMNAVHPVALHQQPLRVILIGTSGGVQVALSAVPYLHQWLHNPQITVISAGGAFSGEEGFDQVDAMYHLQGQRDWVDDVSRIVFPSRWYWIVGSPFNRARQQGRYTVVSSGPHTHDGNEGYFGLAIARPNQTYVELTLQAVNQLPVWSLDLSSHRTF
ncbi:hypothetical protein K9N68_08675 [Kovacikia minuta CCNUW1]|uniref:hypothetical protein n=1 Tax=Kovacikia minuta TaxID=2931930 RepID=UPI001CCB0453|nr:hypothetical protein [Kovacikia minuta]UBF27955.1 hypothetical protein K9N68_08675 [Kovacikia minuta CCNUW1]